MGGRTLMMGLLALFLVTGCELDEAERTTSRAMPAVASAHFNQLSAGNGSRIYGFSIDGKPFAAVLITGQAVTERAQADGYETDTEYWAMDRDVDLTSVETFVIHTVWTGTRLSGKVARVYFEEPTKRWQAWEVNRGFALDDEVRRYTDAPAEDRHLFSAYGPAPAGMWSNPDVDSFLEYHVQFDLGGAVPEITWVLCDESFDTYEAAQDYVAAEDTTIVPTWSLRADSREVLFFGSAKALRIEEGQGFTYSAIDGEPVAGGGGGGGSALLSALEMWLAGQN